MNQQTRTLGPWRSELRIVKVVHVDGDTIGEGGEARGKPYRGSQHRRPSVLGKTEGFHVLLNESPGFSSRTAEGQSQTVQNGFLAEFERLRVGCPQTSGSTTNSAT